MLNLAQTQALVKNAPRLTPNAGTPAGEAILMSGLYRELKALAWQSTGQVHPTDRVSLLTFEAATIRRDKAQAPGSWIITVADQDHPFTGSPADATAEAQRLLTAATVQPLSPAAIEAAALTTEYPRLARRIAAALALVEAGVTEFPRYKTEWQNQTRDGLWTCQCHDARFRNRRFSGGVACKHALAGEITARIKRNQRRVAMQKLADKTQRRERDQALPADVGTGRSITDMLGYNDYAKPSDYNQPADPLNRARRGDRAQFEVRYG